MNPSKLSANMIESLKHYVYLYINPFDKKIFYVGKGRGDRVLQFYGKNPKCQKLLDEIAEKGSEPIVEILVHGLNDDITAKKIEAAAIDLIGIHDLTNKVAGFESAEFGRMKLEELISMYEKEKGIIDDPVILIRINQRYHYGMSDDELYDATRGVWIVAPHKHKEAIYAFAVFGGIVREVYKINTWHRSGTGASHYKTRPELNMLFKSKKWGFEGDVAEEPIRKKYLLKSVEEYLPNHAQNPIRYVKC